MAWSISNRWPRVRRASMKRRRRVGRGYTRRRRGSTQSQRPTRTLNQLCLSHIAPSSGGIRRPPDEERQDLKALAPATLLPLLHHFGWVKLEFKGFWA